MKQSAILAVDAAMNVLLGVLLIAFPQPIVDAFGVPASQSAFYPSMLGAVLTGIGIALIIQIASGEHPEGLGSRGAVAINLSGGFLLATWLLWGDLDLPVRGYVILWSLVGVLLSVSLVELVAGRMPE